MGTIRESYAEGRVTGESDNVGGFVGMNASMIRDSYATGPVTGVATSGGVGGFVGDNSFGSTLTHCYATGMVLDEGEENNNVGGLAGNNIGTINYSYYDKNTTNQDDEGKGIPKTTIEMKQQSTFEGWNFSTVWDITEGESYPFLQWEK